MDNDWYKERWFKKLKIYKELGVLDNLITTSEIKESFSDIEKNIVEIINDIKNGTLKLTENSYSKHHYEI